MNPPVKLLTPWFGPVPDWLGRFRERVSSNKMVAWELLPLANLEEANRRASERLGSPCRKATPYGFCCDLRPMYGTVFAEHFAGYDWWGWCDLDIVIGDLDRLLAPLLVDHDIVSTESYATNGAMTVLRNSERIVNLFREGGRPGEWQEVVEDPEPACFDETGFNTEAHVRAGRWNGNPNFTRIVRESGVRIHYDDRTWTESLRPLDRGIPSRSCEMEGNRLLEIPTGRELLLYHFTSKTWPLPNRFGDRLPLQIGSLAKTMGPGPLPKESPAHWAAKVRLFRKGRERLCCLAGSSVGDWEGVQKHTADLLREHVRMGDRVLDAGCGWGAVLGCFRAAGIRVEYEGVDYCPEMIEVAKGKWDRLGTFRVADLRDLPFADGSFDWCVCRGVEGSVRTLISNRDWKQMQREMLRVAQRLLVIDHSCNHRVLP